MITVVVTMEGARDLWDCPECQCRNMLFTEGHIWGTMENFFKEHRKATGGLHGAFKSPSQDFMLITVERLVSVGPNLAGAGQRMMASYLHPEGWRVDQQKRRFTPWVDEMLLPVD